MSADRCRSTARSSSTPTAAGRDTVDAAASSRFVHVATSARRRRSSSKITSPARSARPGRSTQFGVGARRPHRHGEKVVVPAVDVVARARLADPAAARRPAAGPPRRGIEYSSINVPTVRTVVSTSRVLDSGAARAVVRVGVSFAAHLHAEPRHGPGRREHLAHRQPARDMLVALGVDRPMGGVLQGHEVMKPGTRRRCTRWRGCAGGHGRRSSRRPAPGPPRRRSAPPAHHVGEGLRRVGVVGAAGQSARVEGHAHPRRGRPSERQPRR